MPTVKYVSGFFRICLIDVERNSFILLPKDYLFDLQLLEKGAEEVKARSIDKRLFLFLEENEFLLFIDKTNPLINTSSNYRNFDYYNCVISNFILEISESIVPYTRNIFDQLRSLQTKYVVLYYYNENIFQELQNILDVLDDSFIHCVDIYLDLRQSCKISELNLFLKNYSRIQNLFVYDNMGKLVHDKKPKFIISRQPLSSKCCGVISKNFWVSNLFAINEAKFHNSCLNKKLSVDFEGNIKNCPSMQESFGNIKDTTLAEAIEKPGFKKYWNINKDQIAVCKDCEFRYICTDCRAYVEDPHDVSGPDSTNLSKPLKCGYNPYTGDWEEWSTNPLKQMAIDYYGMREMVETTKG